MKRKLLLWGAAGAALLLLTVVASVSIGSASSLSPAAAWRILLAQLPGAAVEPDWRAAHELIVLQVRLPRVALAILVGAALSVAGAGFQGVLRNPLAEPFTLGVASGASVGAALLMALGLQFVLGAATVPLAAFCTSLATLAFVYLLSRVDGGMRRETLILAGVVVSAFLSAIVSFLVSISGDEVNQILFWLMGSLAMRGWPYAGLLAPYVLVCSAVLIGYARTLNLFELGERNAAHLGVHVERTRWIVLAVSTLLAAAAVSVAGVIGFVGLVVPHMIRLMLGPDYRLIMPLSAIGGAVFLVWSDTLARTALAPGEIPLGVVTAFLGAPFFLYLLIRKRRTIGGEAES